ncbi:MAG TPA: hypothetical protein PK414_14005 [Anaerolineales bacterium]|nr:hypothetical protein [Anaerolineales bacterium]
MKKKLSLLLIAFFLIACQARPKITNYPQPDLSLDFSPFQTADPGIFTNLGCDKIDAPSPLLGGLEPAYPIAYCIINFTPPDGVTTEIETEIKNGLYFFASGGLFPQYYRYVIYRDGEFVIIKSEEDFKNVYAPIESPNEALSYVLAVKRAGAYFNIEKVQGYEYEVDALEDTHVVEDGDGYRINLYEYQVFGCGPHWTYLVIVHLSADGTIQEISHDPVFRDPNEDGLCVD